MRLGTVTSAPAVRNASRLDGAESVTPVKRITADWTEEDPLDELTQSDRALLGHLYGQRSGQDGNDGGFASYRDDAELGSAPVASLAREINRERKLGMVSENRDLTAEDLRQMIGRLTFTAKEPVPVSVQVQLMTMLGGTSHGHLDVVL